MSPKHPARRVGDRRLRIALVLFLLVVCGIAFHRIGVYAWGEYHRRQAEQALAERDFPRAQTSLQRCLAIWPDRPDLHLLAAQSARRQRNIPEAMRQLSLCWKNGGVEEKIALEHRLIEVQGGDLSDAERLRRYCEKHPAAPESELILEALIVGSLSSLELARAQGFLDLWRAAPRNRANQVQGCLWQAALHELAFAPERAREDYREALKLDPANRQARLALPGLVLDDDPEEAAAHLAALQQQTPDDPPVLLLQARLHHNLGRLDEAAESLDRLLAHNPDHVDGLVARGRVALHQRETEAAGRWLRKAERLSPKHHDVLLGLVDYLRATGDVEEAKRYQDRMAQVRDEVVKHVETKARQRHREPLR